MTGDGWLSTRPASRPAALPYRAAALVLWPRLDRARLRRCGDDPHRIVRLVERRTLAAPDCILAMLEKTARELLRPWPKGAGAAVVERAGAAGFDRSRPAGRPGTGAAGGVGAVDPEADEPNPTSAKGRVAV